MPENSNVVDTEKPVSTGTIAVAPNIARMRCAPRPSIAGRRRRSSERTTSPGRTDRVAVESPDAVEPLAHDALHGSRAAAGPAARAGVGPACAHDTATRTRVRRGNGGTRVVGARWVRAAAADAWSGGDRGGGVLVELDQVVGGIDQPPLRRQADLLRRRKRSQRRLNFVLAKTGSIMVWRRA